MSVERYATAAMRVGLGIIWPLRHVESLSGWHQVLASLSMLGVTGVSGAALGWITSDWIVATALVLFALLAIHAWRSQLRLDDQEHSPFHCQPQVIPDEHYGENGDEVAFYVRVRVSTTSGRGMPGVQARLVRASCADPIIHHATTMIDEGLNRPGFVGASAY